MSAISFKRRLVSLLLLFTPLLMYAEPENPRVTLKCVSEPLSSVMSEITSQTGYMFVVNDVRRETQITYEGENVPLEKALEEILTPLGVKWEIYGDNIILSKPRAAAPFTLRGTVTDASGLAVIGAGVLLEGTSQGTVTDFDGHYNLQVDNPGDAVISFSCIGYQSVSVPLGGREVLDVTLQEESIVLEGTVITALGIRRSEKALSYNVQQVDADVLSTNKDANFINALNGKVAGVVINASSSGVGGASKVVMRGPKSVTQSSNALYVIDGIPMYKRAADGDTEFGSTGSTDPLADLNSEDIESMSVLNGAAAAALYGSDAANGAIVITTRKGREGKAQLTFSSSLELLSPMMLPRFQNRYGTGDYSSSIGSEVKSWSARLIPESVRSGYSPGEDYFRTGSTKTQSLSLSVGSAVNQTYLSAAVLNSDGIVPNNSYDKYNFTGRNTTTFLDGKMTLDLNGSFIIQKDCNMVNQGTYNNPVVGAYLFPRGDSWDAVKTYERYNAVSRVYEQYWPVGDGGLTMQNPYWVNYRTLRENSKRRYMLGATLRYEFASWINLTGRVKVDNSTNRFDDKRYGSTNKLFTAQSEYGWYGVTSSDDRQTYADIILNVDRSLTDEVHLSVNAGASYSDTQNYSESVSGPIPDGIFSDEKPGVENVFALQNLTSTTALSKLQSGWREQTQAVFASAELGWKGAYYLTLTARNDWPSMLAGPHSDRSSFFYPSVGGSWVISQTFPAVRNVFEYMKLRASWASVAIPFARFIANPGHAWDSSTMSYSQNTQYPLYNLLPERTTSYEVGYSARMTQGWSLDVSWYLSHTANQTFDPKISAGSGYSKMYVQSGDISNTGVELSLGYGHSWGELSWDSRFNFSSNRNRIEKLISTITIDGNEVEVGRDIDMGGLGQAHFLLREGGTLGDLYSLIDITRDDLGNIYQSAEGAFTSTAYENKSDYKYLGSVLPKANLSWRNDFSFRGWKFALMFTARLGGIVYSRTQSLLDYFGVSEESAAARDCGYVEINGGDRVDPLAWYSGIAGGNGIPQFYTYSATNLRLSEVSLGYTIPRSKLWEVCDLTLSLIGRNLLMIYCKAPFDPEAVASTGNYYQGLDNFMLPSLRNVGFSLRANF